MQEFMEDDSMHVAYVQPNSGISMQEFIDFDSMPKALVHPNGTQNSGPVFGPTNLPCHDPALMQLPAAATTVGCAPEPAVQEAGTGPNTSRPSISMQEFMDVDSMLSAHDAAHGYAPETMQVFPPAATCPLDPWCSGPAVLFESVPPPLCMIPPWDAEDADMHKAQAQPHTRPTHKAATNQDDGYDAHSPIGLWDDQPWSEAEKEHQMARHRRKDRQALRPIARPSEGQVSPPPPAISYTITLPEKFSCPNLPSLGQTESFEEALATEFRNFTSLGESAEAYIRIVF